MKKFVIRLCILILLVVLADQIVGIVGRYLVSHAKGGSNERSYYIASRSSEDILIMGSSKAAHHYDPSIIIDSLGLSAYNCGFDGNGIITAYSYWRMIRERYIPKVLIYEATINFDIAVGANDKYLGAIRSFYDYPGIDSVFWSIDQTQRVKMLSHTFRYNSKFIEMLKDNVMPSRNFYRGYDPLDGEMINEPAPMDYDAPDIDELKKEYLIRLFKECQAFGTQLIVAVSPIYKCEYNTYYIIEELCKEYDVPYLSHLCDTTFTNHKEYFSDRVHLNRSGATKYSSCIAEELKNILSFD